MPLDKLVERILNDANAEAERITGEAERRREETLADAKTRGEREHDRRLDRIRRTAGEEKKQRVTMEALDARKALLSEKQALLDLVFESALESLLDLPPEEYRDLLVDMVVETAGESGGELILNARDRERLGEEIVSHANRRLEKEGGEGRLSLAGETREIRGGFVLRAGGLEINNSLESQVESRREKLEPRLVEILFKGTE